MFSTKGQYSNKPAFNHLAAMRLLHTSDWHLGQHFFGKTRQAEHQALIDWLLATVNREAVDALVIAGDLFDTASPPSYARELYNQLVLRLNQAGCQLVLLAGNHDSVAVLEESRALLGELGATVVARPGDGQLLTLHDHHGQPAATLCAIPYLRPRDVVQSQAGDSSDDKQRTLQAAIASHYQALYEQARAMGLPVIMTGHLTTVGASVSESVREIYVGSLAAYPANAFPAADYIALGHIHRPQQVGGQAHIRYSGSPLPLSFDEAAQQKQVVLVDITPERTQVETLAVPRFQALASITASLKSLRQQVAPLCQPQQTLWLDIAIDTDSYLSDLQSRVSDELAGLNVEVLRLRRLRRAEQTGLTGASRETLDELTPSEVFARRLAQEALSDELNQALNERYQQTLAKLQESS